MGLKRRRDWERSLGDFVSTHAHDPFIWGRWDCALFTADCIASMTGVDVAADYRGKYTTRFGAVRILKRLVDGWVERLCEAVAAERELEEIPPAYAQRGDAVFVRWEENGAEHETIGVVWLNGRDMAALGQEGLILLPMAAISARAGRAWHIA